MIELIWDECDPPLQAEVFISRHSPSHPPPGLIVSGEGPRWRAETSPRPSRGRVAVTFAILICAAVAAIAFLFRHGPDPFALVVWAVMFILVGVAIVRANGFAIESDGIIVKVTTGVGRFASDRYFWRLDVRRVRRVITRGRKGTRKFIEVEARDMVRFGWGLSEAQTEYVIALLLNNGPRS